MCALEDLVLRLGVCLGGRGLLGVGLSLLCVKLSDSFQGEFSAEAGGGPEQSSRPRY